MVLPADLHAKTQFSRDESNQENFFFAQITALTLEEIAWLDLAERVSLPTLFSTCWSTEDVLWPCDKAQTSEPFLSTSPRSSKPIF